MRSKYMNAAADAGSSGFESACNLFPASQQVMATDSN
jgi:hypothetical protein